MPIFDKNNLISLFNQTFISIHNTQLVCGLNCGQDEPIYLPADTLQAQNRIIFAHGFFASALHEIAHWCVAGKKRRLLEDFGYWYEPDGRTEERQQEFEQVEIKPQALEWIFSVSAGYHFEFSADNLDSALGASQDFKKNVQQQVFTYLKQGLPLDAKTWSDCLIKHYRPNHNLTANEFILE